MKIGGDNRLAVVMRQHSWPNVVCEDVPDWHATEPNIRKMLTACRWVVDQMPASQVQKVFGPSGTAGVDVALPFMYYGEGGNFTELLLRRWKIFI